LQTSEPLQRVIDRLRQAVPALEADRYLAPDLQAAADLIAGGDLVRAAGLDFVL
jgi:histidine ammonia-lyase